MTLSTMVRTVSKSCRINLLTASSGCSSIVTKDRRIGLDRKMLAVLHRRYTLVAKIPLSPDDPHQFWYLWLAELPR